MSKSWWGPYFYFCQKKVLVALSKDKQIDIIYFVLDLSGKKLSRDLNGSWTYGLGSCSLRLYVWDYRTDLRKRKRNSESTRTHGANEKYLLYKVRTFLKLCYR